MQEKDFVSYEYKTVSVKAKDQSKAIDLYEAFGWEITATERTGLDNVTISMKRDRKINHKAIPRARRTRTNVLYFACFLLQCAQRCRKKIFFA